MISVSVALVSAALALLIGSLSLGKHYGRLRTREQCFRFHELRDRLQLLRIEGKIDAQGSVYGFLQFVINLGIRNAGVMKLRQVLGLARQINQKIEPSSAPNIFNEIRQQEEDVQRLAADVFVSLATMVVSNDRIVFVCMATAEVSGNVFKGAVRRGVRYAVRVLMPDHSEALRAAREYRHFGNSFSFHQS